VGLVEPQVKRVARAAQRPLVLICLRQEVLAPLQAESARLEALEAVAERTLAPLVKPEALAPMEAVAVAPLGTEAELE
jgi:hypothetical protein